MDEGGLLSPVCMYLPPWPACCAPAQAVAGGMHGAHCYSLRSLVPVAAITMHRSGQIQGPNPGGPQVRPLSGDCRCVQVNMCERQAECRPTCPTVIG